MRVVLIIHPGESFESLALHPFLLLQMFIPLALTKPASTAIPTCRELQISERGRRRVPVTRGGKKRRRVRCMSSLQRDPSQCFAHPRRYNDTLILA